MAKSARRRGFLFGGHLLWVNSGGWASDEVGCTGFAILAPKCLDTSNPVFGADISKARVPKLTGLIAGKFYQMVICSNLCSKHKSLPCLLVTPPIGCVKIWRSCYLASIGRI